MHVTLEKTKVRIELFAVGSRQWSEQDREQESEQPEERSKVTWQWQDNNRRLEAETDENRDRLGWPFLQSAVDCGRDMKTIMLESNRYLRRPSSPGI